MVSHDLDSVDYTAMRNLSFRDSASYKGTPQAFDFLVDEAKEEENSYVPEWYKWNGYYQQIPEIQSTINKKAEYVIGKGYKVKGLVQKIFNAIRKIKGVGVDTFNTVIRNVYIQAQICGDGFAEIIRDKAGRIINLKPLSPGTMKVVANSRGIIKSYEQVVSKKNEDGSYTDKKILFKPEQIFHLARNRYSDAIHGVGAIEAVERIILARNEAMEDLRVVFHRYVKPLWITSVNTDDATEIAAFKVKQDKAIQKAENMIVPKDTVDNIERVSIPQYSTLDPLPWINRLQDFFIMAEGVPEIILGYGRDTTEASSKILYVAFQQTVENDQFWLEEQIKLQLGWDVEFEFPASLIPELQSDERKDTPINKERRSEVMAK